MERHFCAQVFALTLVTQEKSSPKEPHAQPSSRCFAPVKAAERPRGCPQVLKTTFLCVWLPRASPKSPARKPTGFRSLRDLPRTANRSSAHRKSPVASRGSLRVQQHGPVLSQEHLSVPTGGLGKSYCILQQEPPEQVTAMGRN